MSRYYLKAPVVVEIGKSKEFQDRLRNSWSLEKLAELIGSTELSVWKEVYGTAVTATCYRNIFYKSA
jgi:hypothetical protein